MTTATLIPAEPAAQIVILDIPVVQIIPTPENQRTFSGPDKSNPYLVQLAASINDVGVLEPVLCRPHPDKKGYFELRAGECRWRASKLAGRKTIPAIVRDMTDRDAAKVTIIENKQREDLHPLEEARGIQVLLKHDWTLDDVAVTLGMSKNLVQRRNALNNLSPKWREYVGKHDPKGETLSAAHLELIARYPVATQDEALKALVDRAGKFDGNEDSQITPAGIRNHFRDYMHLLYRTLWKHDDATLVPSQGPCSTCTRRSDCHPELFDAADYVEPYRGKPKPNTGARCLDITCWNEKTYAVLRNKEKELKKEHGEVIILAESKYLMPDTNPFKKRAVQKYFSSYDSGRFESMKPGAKGAIPVLRVDGAEIGKVEWGRIVKHNTAANAKPKAEKEQPIADRRKRLQAQRAEWVKAAVDEHIDKLEQGKAPITGIFKESITSVLALALVMFETRYRAKSNPWTAFDELSDLTAGALSEKLFRLTLGDAFALTNDEALHQTADYLGLDYPALVQKAEKKFPEPKSWAKEEAKTALKPGNAPAKGGRSSSTAKRAKPVPGTCSTCGCSHHDPCVDQDTGESCAWANKDQTVCTFCTDDGVGRNIHRPNKEDAELAAAMESPTKAKPRKKNNGPKHRNR